LGFKIKIIRTPTSIKEHESEVNKALDELGYMVNDVNHLIDNGNFVTFIRYNLNALF